MDYGKVEYCGAILKLIQQPYIDGSYDQAFYQALAEDEEGNEYLIRWQCFSDWQKIYDDVEHCDWRKYKVEKQ